jgi:hypothetical protein
MSDHLLILLPEKPPPALDIARFVHRLSNAGVLGEAFDFYGKSHYRTGSQFADYLDYLREITVVNLEARNGTLVEGAHSPNRLHVHLRLRSVNDGYFVIASQYTRGFNCPKCGHYVEDWQDVISAWWNDQSAYMWKCSACHAQLGIFDMDWSKSNCGITTIALEAWNIHFGEAKPTPEFLLILREATSVDWRWCYARY